LDDHVKQVGLEHWRGVLQPVFDEQQMAGGRNRQELGDAFNDSEEDGNNPVWHGLFELETPGRNKRQIGGVQFPHAANTNGRLTRTPQRAANAS
jgi:hypothetical protein